MAADRRIQLQLRIPYKFQPTWHREVRSRLENGWRIEDYARLSDEEVAVTMVATDAS